MSFLTKFIKLDVIDNFFSWLWKDHSKVKNFDIVMKLN